MSVIVRMRHIRSLDICSSGTRDWFKRYGLNFSQFLSDGLPVEVIESTGDSIGLRVAEQARKEEWESSAAEA